MEPFPYLPDSGKGSSDQAMGLINGEFLELLIYGMWHVTAWPGPFRLASGGREYQAR